MATGVSTVDNFIPEIWSARLISNLNTKLVFGGLCNRDYEGDIKDAGDTVHVNSIGRINLLSYTRNGTLTAAQTLDDDQVSLTITESNAYNFKVDDIDKAQTKGAIMEEAMKEAGYTLANAADEFIAGLHTQATAGSDLATAATTNSDKFYDMLVANRQIFQEADVPIDDLTVVVAPWMESLLLLDDRFIHATSSGDSVLKTGEIGRAAGTRIVVSNNLATTTTTYHVMTFAGNKGISFADQIAKTEAYRPELGFQDAVKGLHVYGANTMRPDFVLVSDVDNT